MDSLFLQPGTALSAADTGCRERWSAVKHILWLVIAGSFALALLSPGAAAGVIEVQGRGEALASPDKVTVRIGVQVEDEEAQAALAETNAVMEALVDIFLEHTSEENIHTVSFDLRRSEHWDADQGTMVSGPFRVRHVMEVSLHEIEAAAAMIDLSVEAGANIVHNIHYSVEDTKALQETAYAAAKEQARWKAEQLKPRGTVLEIKAIREAETVTPQLRTMEDAAAAGTMMPGQMHVTAAVEVTYRMVQE